MVNNENKDILKEGEILLHPCYNTIGTYISSHFPFWNIKDY